MSQTMRIAVDLARVYERPDGRTPALTLAWGDEVEVEEITDRHVRVRLQRFEELEDGSVRPFTGDGFIRPSRRSAKEPREVVADPDELRVLRVDSVDVQQGDGTVIESPGGRLVLLDGGDNQLFARYLAARFRRHTPDDPQPVDAIVISHGDADHFRGLTEIHASETHRKRFKRLFLDPRRVYHSGLVKRPRNRPDGSQRPDEEMFGETAELDGRPVAVALEEDLLAVPEAELNFPFRQWRQALEAWTARGSRLEFRRLRRGDHDAFDFLRGEGIETEVLGPMPVAVGGREGLVFLGKPREGLRPGHESLALDEEAFAGISASHTINGHSIILRIRFGRYRFLFSGDLNDQAGRALTRAHNEGEIDLTAEVFKVPHHGSADFSAAFLEAVAPVVSVISSGDEDANREHIHPRATIVGALGRYSRVAEPLVFVTELVAFFQQEGYVTPEMHAVDEEGDLVFDSAGHPVLKKNLRGRFFAFSRKAFGIVKVRTDGERLLVYTNSGKEAMKEAYAYAPDPATGLSEPQRVIKA